MNMDDYTKDQLQEIEEGKQAGVDVSVYEFQKRMPLLPAGRKKYSMSCCFCKMPIKRSGENIHRKFEIKIRSILNWKMPFIQKRKKWEKL